MSDHTYGCQSDYLTRYLETDLAADADGRVTAQILSGLPVPYVVSFIQLGFVALNLHLNPTTHPPVYISDLSAVRMSRTRTCAL